MQECRRCQYDLSMLDDSSICPECGCNQRDYLRPMMTGTERLLMELMAVSFVISTAMVVLGAASSASAGGSAPARVPAWFFNLGFVWSYLSVLVSVYLLALATNNLSGKWRPILITLLCAFPIFLLWLFCIALLIALLS